MSHCLYLYFAGTLGDPTHITSRAPSKVGRALAGRFVSRLEIVTALKRLKAERGDLLLILELKYADWLPIRSIAERLHLSPTTVSKLLDDARNRLIDQIWVDPDVA